MSDDRCTPPDRLTEELREFVMSRDDRECQWCGSDDDALEIHHKKPRADGGTHHPQNLVTVCAGCHRNHHSKMAEDDVDHDLSDTSLDPAPADYKIINAVEDIGSAGTGAVADEAGISHQHTLRRLYALAAADIVAQTSDREWDLADNVDDPAIGRLPDDPERAARHARDDMMRRMRDRGMSHAEIADVAGLDDRTVPVAINRARALDPPLPPTDQQSETEITDLERRLSELERRVIDDD